MSSTETSVHPLNPPFLSIVNLALHIPAVRHSCCMLSGFMLLYAASFSNHSLVVSHISFIFLPHLSLFAPGVINSLSAAWLQSSHDHKCASRERCQIRASSSFWFVSSRLTGMCELMLQSAKVQPLWTYQQSEWFMFSKSIAVFQMERSQNCMKRLRYGSRGFSSSGTRQRILDQNLPQATRKVFL